MRIDVVFTPDAATLKKVDGRQGVVIDTLRCTTTMLAALANGARGIIPVAEPAEAVALRAKLGAEAVLLGGERGGVRIENFDLGNSPFEYRHNVVHGKTVALCTTNGTPAFTNVRWSGPVWIGGFVNLSTLCGALESLKLDVLIACAGNEGEFSLEDTLCAGAIVTRLNESAATVYGMNDSARFAALLYDVNKTRVLEAIREGEHAQRLISLGFGADIEFAAAIDSIPIAPQFRDGYVTLTTGALHPSTV